MRNLILSTLSTLVLLIYPLSLSAQNSFSLSLDVDGATGDQAVTSLNTSADQVIAIQIFGNNIQNANGLAVRFEYDASQVTYEGFDAGDVLPNAQALPEQGTGYVEIGIASLGGQATANSGLVGTVRFRTTGAFSSTMIRLMRAELSRNRQFETIMPNISIALQTPPAPANFSLSLDVDGSAGDQAVTSANISTDETVAIEIFGTDIRNANGLSVRFEYDASQVTYEGFDAGNVLPNAQALPSQGTNPTFVELGIASLGGQATANNGLVGTVRFRTTAGFSGTEIRLVRAELGRGGRFETVTIDMRVELKLQVLTPDFNRDGTVNFADFLAFAGQYGTRQGDGKYEAKYDLDSDGAIGFSDFLTFSSSYGKDVSPPRGPGNGSGTIVTIPDANLRAVIADSLGKAYGAPISRTEMATLTVLEAPNSNISDLTGLEHATGLTSLWISANSISDVMALSSLTNLTSLWLWDNLISDVSPLSGLTNLTGLSLHSNLISDLAPLANLTNLTGLGLGNNLISDLAPLANLTNLRSLGLHSNLISDLAPLANLTNLRSIELPSNTISNVAPLSGLTNLTLLRIYDNRISDLSPLVNLKNLKGLELSGNLITDVTVLSGMTNLTGLQLSSNPISNVTMAVAILSNLTNLTYLTLAGNSISDSDMAPLSNLTNLTGLNLSDNLISDVSALSSLTKLERLYLSVNNISDLTPLSNLTNLTDLTLVGNAISDISALSGMTNLRSLRLYTNSISNLSPLVANTGLGSGDLVDVRDNPLSATSINTHIPALQNRGVNVQFGASKPAVEAIERSRIHEDWEAGDDIYRRRIEEEKDVTSQE